MNWFPLFFMCIISLFSCTELKNFSWPIPYERFNERPANDKFCQAQYPFCLGGFDKDKMPIFDLDDNLEIFALKAPVWEFRFGKLLKYFNIMHDAIGIRSQKTGKNYTMEWYELDQLLNCTFPHLLKGDFLMWCNQGATCITPGIDDLHWSQNGTLVQIGEMTGKQFQRYSEYALWDNRTGIYYQTFTVQDHSGDNLWFEAHDCSTFVLNSFNNMAEIGVKFNKSISLNYTQIQLISSMPILLGNISEIVKNQSLHKDLIDFYSHFQKNPKIEKMLEQIILILDDVVLKRKFYLYYNYQYWYLPMQYPFVKLTYNQIQLP